MSEPRVCDLFARRLRSASDPSGEALAGAARDESAHLEACRDCREELARRDPAALFALLAFEKKDDAFFTGFETRVMAGIRESEREERGGWLGAILRPRLLALCAGVAAVTIALVVWMGQPAQPPRLAETAHPRPEGDAPAAGAADRQAPSAGSGQVPGAAASPVTSVASATARVISVKVAEPQQEPFDLVLIVDPEMPL
jgi:hypothetical protein